MRYHLRRHWRMVCCSWTAFRCWFVSNKKHDYTAYNHMCCVRCGLALRHYLELRAWERQ
jgi:hypothetical protein